MAYFVTKRDNGWAVIKGSAKKALKIFKTQKDAMAFAKELANKNNTTYQVQDKEGKFRKK